MRALPRRVVAMAGLTAALAGPAAAVADGVMLIPAGPFWMGRDDGAPNEAPLQRVYVGDFWIERHKVTKAQFATFLAIYESGRRRC